MSQEDDAAGSIVHSEIVEPASAAPPAPTLPPAPAAAAASDDALRLRREQELQHSVKEIYITILTWLFGSLFVFAISDTIRANSFHALIYLTCFGFCVRYWVQTMGHPRTWVPSSKLIRS